MVVQRPVFRGRLRARAHFPLSPPYLDSGLPGFRGRTAAAHLVAEHQRPDRCEPDELERLRFLRYVYLPWHSRQPVRSGLASPVSKEPASRGGRNADPERQEVRCRCLRRGSIQVDLLFRRPRRRRQDPEPAAGGSVLQRHPRVRQYHGRDRRPGDPEGHRQPAERLQRHLVPAPGRPEQLGNDRLQPGDLIRPGNSWKPAPVTDREPERSWARPSAGGCGVTLVLIGLVGGILTGLSPCVLTVLPVVLLGGGSAGPDTGPDAESARRRPYLVVLGLTLSFAVFTLFGSLILASLHLPDDAIR